MPATSGKGDRPYRDENLNLVVCPLPYDGAFVETFYEGWRIVQQTMAAQVEMPSDTALPLPAERLVAKELVIRRTFPVVEVVAALEAQAQPELLETVDREASVVLRRGNIETGTVVAPVALTLFDL